MTIKNETSPPLVAIIMGNTPDWEIMRSVVDILEEFGVPFEARVVFI